MRRRLDQPKKQTLREIEKLWYAKLAEDGFQDIEVISKNKRLLKEWDSNFFRNNFDETQYLATKAYYEEAWILLDEYEFENETHKEIWALHCEGITEREIAKKVTVYKKSMVHYVITLIAKRVKRKKNETR